MKIQINTDASLECSEAMATQISTTVDHVLQRFRDRITRVEVHLSVQKGDKGAQHDKRCVMEARLEGRQPIAATDQAATPQQAVRGAADKLARLIDSQLGRVANSSRSQPSPTAVPDLDTGPGADTK